MIPRGPSSRAGGTHQGIFSALLSIVRLLGVRSHETTGATGSAANFDSGQRYPSVRVMVTGGLCGDTPGEFTVDANGLRNATSGGRFSAVQDSLPKGNRT